MAESGEKIDSLFLQLIMSLQATALQQMGKVASPVTGKVERNLEIAKNSIDIIAMLQTKTAGNLTPDEKRYIDHVLYELRLNYVDEVKKDEKAKAETSSASETQQPAASDSQKTEPADDTTNPPSEQSNTQGN
jgi:DNA replication initiation complex subunit (GINS family)